MTLRLLTGGTIWVGELWEALFGSVVRRALAADGKHPGEAGVREAMLGLRSQTPLRLSWATGAAAGLLNSSRPGYL
jgi:hypothetical protein